MMWRVTWVANAVLGCSALMFAACTAINPTFGAETTGGESDSRDGTSPSSSAEGSSGPTASDSISSTTLPSTTTGSESSTSMGMESSTGSDEGGFLEPTTGCGSEFPDGVLAHCTIDPCSTWDQNCPDGEACRAWANDGGSAWNSTRCSPIEDNPGQAGDPCWAMGSATSGVDSCDVGLMCWDVDSQSLEGTCIEYCAGTPGDPTCESPEQTCSVTSDGVLALCLTTCAPLLGDCVGGSVCVPSPGNEFVCIPQSGSACQSGFVEVPAAVVEDCVAGEPCCASYCDLSQTLSCDGPLECVALFDEPQPGDVDVGLCVTPM